MSSTEMNFLEKCVNVSQKMMDAYSSRQMHLKEMRRELKEEQNKIMELVEEGNATDEKIPNGVIGVLESSIKNFDNAVTVIQQAIQETNWMGTFIGNIYRNNLLNGCTSKLFDSMFLSIEKTFVRDCPLHLAILNDDYEGVVNLCESKEELKLKDPWGRNALHVAISCSPKYYMTNDLTKQDVESYERLKIVSHTNALKIIKLLLEYGLDPDNRDDLMKWNAFEYASTQNAFNALHLLCEKYPQCSFKFNGNFCAFINVSLFWYPTNLINNVRLDDDIICKTLEYVDKYGDDRSVLCDVLKKFKSEVASSKTDNFKNSVHRAAINGRSDFMKLLISTGSSVNEVNSNGETPLHLSCANNQVECTKLLLESRADVSTMDKDQRTPIHNATGNMKIFHMLLEYDSNVDFNAMDVNGWTVLHHAVKNSNLDCVKFLIENGSDITALTDKKLSVLHIAAKYDDVEMFDYILNKVEDIDVVDGDGQTALMYTLKNMNVVNAESMIDEGASLTCTDENGNSPLHLVSKVDQITLLRQMLEKEVPVNAVNVDGQTALHLAVENNSIRCVRTLIMNKANVNYQDKKKNTPLSLSMKIGYPMAALLIYNGANVALSVDENICIALENNHVDVIKLFQSKGVKEYSSVLCYAMKNGCFKCVEYLIENGTNICCRSPDCNPFYLAALNGHEVVIKHAVNHKYNIDMVLNGYTALSYASSKNNSDAVKMLIRQGAAVNFDNCPSPLMRAASCGSQEIITILINSGANVNYCYDNRTVLHYLIWSNDNVDCAKILVRHGANITTVTSRESPLKYAQGLSRPQIRHFLIEMGAR